MPTEILAVGTTAANSDDITVAAGETLTIALKDAAGVTVDPNAVVTLLLKDDADPAQYFRIDQLDHLKPALVIAPGTWRLTRQAGASCGVFSA